MRIWDNITHGQIFLAIIISYAYTFHWLRSNQLSRKLYEDTLAERGLGMVIKVVFFEVTYVVGTFFLFLIPFAFLLLIFTIAGSIIDWLISPVH